MTKRHLLVACAVPAMIFAYAVPASAQDVSAADTTQDQPDTPAAGTSAENEIVVTAQGRSQVLADVPVAISAVTAESLEKSGATDIRELNQLAPSLLVSVSVFPICLRSWYPFFVFVVSLCGFFSGLPL